MNDVSQLAVLEAIFPLARFKKSDFAPTRVFSAIETVRIEINKAID
jgi:hypothetical protein